MWQKKNSSQSGSECNLKRARERGKIMRLARYYQSDDNGAFLRTVEGQSRSRFLRHSIFFRFFSLYFKEIAFFVCDWWLTATLTWWLFHRRQNCWLSALLPFSSTDVSIWWWSTRGDPSGDELTVLLDTSVSMLLMLLLFVLKFAAICVLKSSLFALSPSITALKELTMIVVSLLTLLLLFSLFFSLIFLLFLPSLTL